jgi:Ca2+-binding EF-hand superfamily protein
MDKLKQFARERFERSTKCRELFDEIDADGSGELDSAEMRLLIHRMGLEEQLENPDSLAELLAEIDGGTISPKASPNAASARNAASSNDGKINREELLSWYLTKGVFYLERQNFQSMDLEVPSMRARRELFKQMDEDGSGELTVIEVTQAARQIWPHVAEEDVIRGLSVADEDSSGLIAEFEFKQMIGFVLYFNTKRHAIAELRDHLTQARPPPRAPHPPPLPLTRFGGQLITGDEFYTGCSFLGESLEDADAAEHFGRLCSKNGQVLPTRRPSCGTRHAWSCSEDLYP